MFTKLLTLLLLCISIFGDNINQKRIDSNDVTIEQYPYLASIRYYDNHICSGVVVNEICVLTSLQCVKRNKLDIKKLTIKVGATKHANGQEYTIASIIGKDGVKFNSQIENDIAILKLGTKLIFNEKINKIDLHGTRKIPDGSIAQLIGWGVVDDVDYVLRKNDETLISYVDCNFSYSANMISFDMICAKNNGKGICQGDMGGPLILENKLIGIASWNFGCNDDIHPDVFASTLSLYDWIIENTDN